MEDDVRTQGNDDHRHAKDRGLGQSLPLSPHLSLSLLASELWESQFLLFEAVQPMVLGYGSPDNLICVLLHVGVTSHQQPNLSYRVISQCWSHEALALCQWWRHVWTGRAALMKDGRISALTEYSESCTGGTVRAGHCLAINIRLLRRQWKNYAKKWFWKDWACSPWQVFQKKLQKDCLCPGTRGVFQLSPPTGSILPPPPHFFFFFWTC